MFFDFCFSPLSFASVSTIVGSDVASSVIPVLEGFDTILRIRCSPSIAI
ncbi:hypothetical protein S1OALGB6SA_1863 [Olavius algarvensis spirochete endosymbiont]|nr:hypothetical protein S1OALGB6SA_1863 [Olavius algarvensis spirochete endosymbiont]